jgi:acetyl-CoA carboxylase biotin carboxyl carrier protein
MDHSTIEAFAETFAKAPRLAEMEIRSASQGTLRFRRSLQSAEKKPRPAAAKPSPSVTSVVDTQVTPESVESMGTLVTSTLVGIFRLSTKLPVSVGSVVTAGQAIGAIEVMRLSDEITAPVSGGIAAVFVQDGEPVEYGQPLFEIIPETVDEGQEADA